MNSEFLVRGGINQTAPGCIHWKLTLEEPRIVRSSGGAVKETAYYPALSNLFNEVGKKLKPRVRCIIHLQGLIARKTSAGLSDNALSRCLDIAGAGGRTQF